MSEICFLLVIDFSPQCESKQTKQAQDHDQQHDLLTRPARFQTAVVKIKFDVKDLKKLFNQETMMLMVK